MASMSGESSNGSSYIFNPLADNHLTWSSSLESGWSDSGIGESQNNRISSQLHASQRENAHLSRLLGMWKAKYEALESAYKGLLDRVSPNCLSNPKPLDPKDYPNIQFWYKHQWISSTNNRITDISGEPTQEDGNEVEDLCLVMENLEPMPPPRGRRGQSRSQAGINVSMLYMELEDGKIIDGHRAKEIRVYARSVFVGFAMKGKTFSSWGDSDADSKMEYYTRMANRFEEIRYCDLDWKAEQVAVDTFPGWKVTWTNKLEKEERERKDGPGENQKAKKAVKKRPHSEDTMADPVNSVAFLENESSTLHTAFSSSQLVPSIHIIPGTPARPPLTRTVEPIPPATANFPNRPSDATFLQSTFQIGKPFYSGNTFPASLLPAHNTGTSSEHRVGFTVPPLPNEHPAEAPAKRARTGGNKMRPTKSSITARNLCAQAWVASNPKGTTDEFAAYYDGLTVEEKQVWEQKSAQRSAEAKKTDDI